MEQLPKTQVLSRKQSHSEDRTRSGPSPGLSWRKISFVLGPVFLACLNLVSAHFEKLAWFDKADKTYLALKGEGEKTKKNLVRAGQDAGLEKYRQIVRSAEISSGYTLTTAERVAKEQQVLGTYLGQLKGEAADATDSLMGPMKNIAVNLLEMTKAEVKLYHGIETSVDPTSVRLTYVKGGVVIGSEERSKLEGEISRRQSAADRLFREKVASASSHFPMATSIAPSSYWPICAEGR